MDSLLDTLTNVVGILLLVMILTSVQMNAALSKILSEIMPVTPEQFQANKVLRENKLKELEELNRSVSAFSAPDEITQQLAELDLEIDDMNSETSVADLQAQLAALQPKIEEEEAKKKVNEENVNAASSELNRLIALLQGFSTQEGPPPTVVTLPAGREARDDAEARFVMCVGGRAYWIGDFYEHAIAVRNEIEKNFAKLVYTGEEPGSYTYSFQGDEWLRDRNRYDDLRPRNAEGLVFRRFRYDGKKVIKHFQDNESKLGTPDLIYYLSENTDRLTLAVGPRKGGGLAIDELFKSGSKLIDGFKSTFRDSLGKQHYLYFVVAPDSYAVYLEARTVAEQRQIPNGWRPWIPGETPKVNAQINEATHRMFLDYDVSVVPLDALNAHAQKILPNLRTLMEGAETAASVVPDPALRQEVTKWVSTYFKTPYFDTERNIPQATPLFRGAVKVVTSPQLPDVPLIRIFAKAPPQPTEVPKPSTPQKPAPPKKVTRDLLD